MLRAFEKRMEEKRRQIRVVSFKFSEEVAFEVMGKDVISHLGLGGHSWWKVYSTQDQPTYLWIHDKNLIGCALEVGKAHFTFDKTRLPEVLGLVSLGPAEFGKTLAKFEQMTNGYFKFRQPNIEEFERMVTLWSEHWGVLHLGQVTTDIIAARNIVTI